MLYTYARGAQCHAKTASLIAAAVVVAETAPPPNVDRDRGNRKKKKPKNTIKQPTNEIDDFRVSQSRDRGHSVVRRSAERLFLKLGHQQSGHRCHRHQGYRSPWTVTPRLRHRTRQPGEYLLNYIIIPV